MRNDRACPLDMFSVDVAVGLGNTGTWLFLGALGDPSSEQGATAFCHHPWDVHHCDDPGGLKGRDGPARPSAEAGVCVPVHSSGSGFCFGEWVGDRRAHRSGV